MDELYSKEILRLAAEVPVIGRLARPEVTVTKTSRICGSRITVDVNFTEDRVSAYGQEVKACALGQGSSAIVAKRILGKSWAELAPVMAAVEKLLAGEGEGPGGEWKAFEAFTPARAFKSRHSAILLPFVALKEAFEIHGKGTQKTA
ncbi:MAG TPA: iron-sulfur cluster assembly scaffold protein [Sphingomonadales bacterium]|nr:iron-sulfur cluster assembly scaffold protein [Sphingomonadales bacterium]